MGIDQVRSFLRSRAPDLEIVAHPCPGTGRLNAQIFDLPPAVETRTLLVTAGRRHVIVVLESTSKMCRQKFRHLTGTRLKLLKPELVELVTGHPTMAVSPLALASRLRVYLDDNLLTAPRVAVSAGAVGLAVITTPARLCALVNGIWAPLTSVSPVIADRAGPELQLLDYQAV